MAAVAAALGAGELLAALRDFYLRLLDAGINDTEEFCMGGRNRHRKIKTKTND
jgi:hypothetical protein